MRYRLKLHRVVSLASLGLAMGSSFAPAARGAPATPDGPSAGDAPSDPGSTIVVTGVRGGKPRTVADSAAPIDAIQGDQLAGPGRADVAESLSKLLPSIGFGTTTAGVNSMRAIRSAAL